MKLPIPELVDRVEIALGIIRAHGQTDGSHHKAWVIDQVTRALTGKDYDRWVKAYKAGEYGPETFGWDEGSIP